MPIIISPHHWPAIAEVLTDSGQEWPSGAMETDWIWWGHEVQEGRAGRMPGRPQLAKRWCTTSHKARRLLEYMQAVHSPADRQPTASATTETLEQSAEIRQPTASPPPGHTARPPDSRQPIDTAQNELGGSGENSPAHRQPVASATTETLALSAGIHQPTASPPPAGQPIQQNPPPDPPIDLSSLDTELVAEKGGLGGLGPTPHATTREAQRFLVVYRTWAVAPTAPQRWRTPLADAVEFFLELTVQLPGVDWLSTLNRWNDWLGMKAEDTGRAGTAGRSRFPKNWKNGLRNFAERQRRYTAQAQEKPNGPHRPRGAWANAPARRSTAAQSDADGGGDLADY